ncbi:MAG: radical SAM protein, partial [Actinobacteria bacterium]|nr:radical SAM protein [Actinomycetota bacterium]
MAGLWSHEETGNLATYARDQQVARWARDAGVTWTQTPQTGVIRRLQDRDTWTRQRLDRLAVPVLPAPEVLRGTAVDPGPLPVAPACADMVWRQEVTETAGHLIDGFGRHRAYVQVQNGCDHRCTFCIIPYGRGQNRSVPMEVIIRQVETLADHGVAEVVLTGVDVASWGGDLDGAPRLGQLVRRLLRQAPSLKRLRMSSIDPAAIDEDLLLALAEDQRLMPHLHLSVQHGDDLILKRMKRRHLRGDVLALVERVRDVRPETVFGADLIAGF